MTMRPVIGISVDAEPEPDDARTRGKLTLNWNYAQAVADAGGVPLLLPPQADANAVISLIDGWLIPGGNDIDPAHWGEPQHPKTRLVASERHEFERRLYAAAPADMPILGICYGCQFLNVVEGGSLIQHLPDHLGHSEDQGGTLQKYRIASETRTAAAVASQEATGESWHHQAIANVADAYMVTAQNLDGTIEGIEHRHRPWVVGVQWHPERTPEANETRSLFAAFVKAAGNYRHHRKRS